ncbi:MAG: thiamine pyrophosphate-binding protein [Pseudomonadota bacterium]
MKGTEFLLRSLVADGVDHLFMMTGGLVDPFLPAIGNVPEITPVVAAHEGGAAAMADGYARASGRIGACLCIGGPGLTNTVTSMSAAYTDESPVLLLTGAVENYMQGLGLFRILQPLSLCPCVVTCRYQCSVEVLGRGIFLWGG